MEIIYDYHSLFIVVSAILSAIGCLLIIISSIAFKKLHTYSFRLVTYLSIADFIASISFILPGRQSYEMCLTQAISQNYSQLASLLITGIISFSLFEMIVKQNSKITNYENLLISLSFIIPAVLTPLPLFTSSYGDANGWCWIYYHSWVDTFWVVLEFYGPLIFLLIINTYFYYRIYKKLWNDQNLEQNGKIIRKLMNRLKMYPIVLMICFGPSLLHRIYYIFYHDDNYWINIVAGTLNALYGFLNAIVYGATTKFKKTLGRAIKKMFTPSQESTVSTNLLE